MSEWKTYGPHKPTKPGWYQVQLWGGVMTYAQWTGEWLTGSAVQYFFEDPMVAK